MSTVLPFTNYYNTNGFGSITDITFVYVPIAGWDWVDGWSWYESLNCDVIDLKQNNKVKNLVKTVDIYGRDVMSTNQAGMLIYIYSDLTISKVYRF